MPSPPKPRVGALFDDVHSGIGGVSRGLFVTGGDPIPVTLPVISAPGGRNPADPGGTGGSGPGATSSVPGTNPGPTGGRVDDPLTVDKHGPYQWYRDDVAIPGAVTQTYIITDADRGTVLHVVAGGVTTNGVTTGGVVSGDIYIQPTITGNNSLGDTLTVHGSGAIQWYRNGVAIGGATSATYVITANDLDTTITVHTNGEYSDELLIEFDGYTLYISADTSDYNVYDAFVVEFGTPPLDVDLLVVADSDVVVSATTTSTAGLTWGNSWTGAPTFAFVNESSFIGKGGAGGDLRGDWPVAQYAGFPGGKAIELSGQTVSITNGSGYIWGGGGGGGSGSAGGGGGLGGGGGGAGDGAGGICINEPDAPPDFVESRNGTSGLAPSGALTAQAGGIGGLGQYAYVLNAEYTSYGGDGGGGGAYGAAGAAGTQGYYDPDFGDPVNGDLPGGPGGAAGKAINLSGGTAIFLSGSGSPNVKGLVS